MEGTTHLRILRPRATPARSSNRHGRSLAASEIRARCQRVPRPRDLDALQRQPLARGSLNPATPVAVHHLRVGDRERQAAPQRTSPRSDHRPAPARGRARHETPAPQCDGGGRTRRSPRRAPGSPTAGHGHPRAQTTAETAVELASGDAIDTPPPGVVTCSESAGVTVSQREGGTGSPRTFECAGAPLVNAGCAGDGCVMARNVALVRACVPASGALRSRWRPGAQGALCDLGGAARRPGGRRSASRARAAITAAWRSACAPPRGCRRVCLQRALAHITREGALLVRFGGVAS